MKTTRKVQCGLCPRLCVLAPGERGFCRARENLDGELVTLVYGNPCAVHIDPVEKKPLSHVLPGTKTFSIATAGCNLRCRFCQNWEISQRPPEETSNYHLPPAAVVEQAVRHNCPSISYTYTEPMVFYEYAYDTSVLARQRGLKNILVTAGYINEKPLRELCPVIDAANVDLKGDEEYYRKVVGGTLPPVLRTLEIMRKMGVWVEVTNLIVPTLNDRTDRIEWLAGWVHDHLGAETPLYFSRFQPLYQLRNLPPTPVETLRRAREIALGQGLRYVYTGNIPGDPGENTICPNCHKTVIGRIGYLIRENNLKDGKCGFCGQEIAGLWK
jgi:pyruvate formate lyase activating enzyme